MAACSPESTASRCSSSLSQISLQAGKAGKAGTACHSSSTGVLLMIAIVAACSPSAMSMPVNVAPTITPRYSSTMIRAFPAC